jgi:hypothetical protein
MEKRDRFYGHLDNIRVINNYETAYRLLPDGFDALSIITTGSDNYGNNLVNLSKNKTSTS